MARTRARAHQPAGPSTGALAPFALGPVVFIAAATVALLLAVAARDGYHRDELYFLEASKHLAFGYVDQPPLSVLMIWLSVHAFGNSISAIRVIPALADGALVLLAAMIARELGGDRFAQAFSALCVAVAGYLVAAHLAGPTVYDQVAWAGASFLILRILRTGDGRLWLAVGAVVGVGLQDKETILFLVFGLAVGLLTTGHGHVLRRPGPWVGGLVALAIWSPNVVWEVAHHWPTAEMDRNLRAEHSGLGSAITFPLLQLLLPNILLAGVWLSGLWALWREPRFLIGRPFAVAYAALFVLLIVLIPDRSYYLAPLYVVLFAAGAVVTEQVVAGSRRFFVEGPPRRRLIWRSRPAAVTFALVAGVVMLPIALPVLPTTVLATVPLQNLNYNLGETIGWPELVATVARVYRSLPDDGASVVVLTANYGEAGAIDRYGGEFGLPRAYSGHNSYWWWGVPNPSTGVTIAVGFDEASSLRRYFGTVTLAARIQNAAGVDNDEDGEPVWVCSDQRAPWPRIWPTFRHYG